jgi:hypothetical protein
MNRLENLMRPYIPLFVEGAIFTGACTLASFLDMPSKIKWWCNNGYAKTGSPSLGDQEASNPIFMAPSIKYLSPKPTAITSSIVWMGFVATQKVAEGVIKQFAKEYVSKSKYFTLPLSLIISLNLGTLVLIKLKVISPFYRSDWRKKENSPQSEEYCIIVMIGAIFTFAMRRIASAYA